MTGRVRNALLGCALAVASVALVLLLAEAGVRLVEARTPQPREPEPLPPELEGLPTLRTIAELAQPNVRGLHGRALYRTNSAGMRGPEIARKPPPGTFRIALAGDSYTMGWKIAEEETYARRLQVLLDDAALPDARFEVLNLGLGGLDARQVMRRLQRVGMPFQPHLLVYGFTLNDIYSPRRQSADDGERRRELLEEWLRFADSPSHLLRLLWPRWISLRNTLLLPEGTEEERMQERYADPQQWRRITRALDRLAGLARRRGACAVVLVHPDVSQLRFFHPFTDLYDKVGRAARERGLAVAQAFPYYRGRDANALRVSTIDGHPNAQGHALLAEALFDALLGLPPRCGLPLRPEAARPDR